MEWAYSLGSRCLSEFAGSLMLYTLAIGGVFNALLPRAKGQGMGLFAIAAGVAGGVGVPTAILYRVSCYFNPAVLLADAVRGKVGAADFWALAASIVAGHFTGAVLLYIVHLPHLNAVVTLPPEDEVERLLLNPATLSNVALSNASFNPDTPAVSGVMGMMRLGLADLKSELGRAWRARRLRDPLHACSRDLQGCGCSTSGYFERQGEAAGQLAWDPSDTPKPSCPPDGSGAAAEAGQCCSSSGGCTPTAAACGAGPPQHAGGFPNRRALAGALCKARQDVLLSVFVTRPAIWSPVWNFLSELVATTFMGTGALLLFEQARFMQAGSAQLWLPQAGMLVGLLNGLCVLALGAGTGPAMNPGRDLGPRIAFSLLPIAGKGSSEWLYGLWAPLLGGMTGGAVAGGLATVLSDLIS